MTKKHKPIKKKESGKIQTSKKKKKTKNFKANIKEQALKKAKSNTAKIVKGLKKKKINKYS